MSFSLAQSFVALQFNPNKTSCCCERCKMPDSLHISGLLKGHSTNLALEVQFTHHVEFLRRENILRAALEGAVQRSLGSSLLHRFQPFFIKQACCLWLHSVFVVSIWINSHINIFFHICSTDVYSLFGCPSLHWFVIHVNTFKILLNWLKKAFSPLIGNFTNFTHRSVSTCLGGVLLHGVARVALWVM